MTDSFTVSAMWRILYRFPDGHFISEAAHHDPCARNGEQSVPLLSSSSYHALRQKCLHPAILKRVQSGVRLLSSCIHQRTDHVRTVPDIVS